MKNFREFSEEKPPSDVFTKAANLDVGRSNRAALLINEGDGAGSKPGRESPGSLMSQNSSVLFCSHKRMTSVKYSDSLQLNCTEGLGFESSDEREDSVSLGSDHSTASSPRPCNNNNNNNNNNNDNNTDSNTNDGEGEGDGDRTRDDSQGIIVNFEEDRRGRGFHAAAAAGPTKRSGRPPGGFPPPLPSIARNGQPWIILRSFRTGGRFVLQEVKAPPHEILHAWRQDGRLKLQLVHRVDEGPCPAPDDATGDDDGDGDGDGSANPVQNEGGIADVADVQLDGAESPSEILH